MDSSVYILNHASVSYGPRSSTDRLVGTEHKDSVHRTVMFCPTIIEQLSSDLNTQNIRILCTESQCSVPTSVCCGRVGASGSSTHSKWVYHFEWVYHFDWVSSFQKLKVYHFDWVYHFEWEIMYFASLSKQLEIQSYSFSNSLHNSFPKAVLA